MSRTNLQRLIDHGRKAGLRTSEIYGSLAATRMEGKDPAPGQADGNGYASSFVKGHLVYRPQADQVR